MELISWEVSLVNPPIPALPAAGVTACSRQLTFCLDTVKYFDDGFVIPNENTKANIHGSSTQVGNIWAIRNESVTPAVTGPPATVLGVVGGAFNDKDLSEDLQDFTARGVLIASPTIYLYSWQNGQYDNGSGNLTSNNLEDTNAIIYDLYYRFVQVPLTEYLGIIQSQQLAQRLV